ncbi:sortilin isoform X1 [Denticeps clupeoides]|uniref:Sortilin n=1 Tax=Denticeps clupeoides TaxID=299321 RepID=A0AAY4CUM7_9TELE|nr:sortilin-like isoform X1 [Denticeps clupeoides]XP_028855261.1 sortilin-like isoform X1 [Denticeps clupeoides]
MGTFFRCAAVLLLLHPPTAFGDGLAAPDRRPPPVNSFGASEPRELQKRSPGEACRGLQDIQSRLQNNTHSNVFNDLSGSVSLAWVGDGTGVLLALTTFQVPLFMIRIGQSKLYRSEDYGKTFQDVTHLINHTFIQTELGIAIGPENSGKVILTGDLLERSGAQIFRSVDFGRSFAQTSLPFHPRMQIIYNPHNSDVLLAISSVNDMWLSEDFGVNWRRSHDMVCLVKWGPENTIFFSTNPNGSCSDRGSLELKKTSDYGRTFKTIGSRIYSFGLGGRFVFSSVMTGVGSTRMIHVSVDQGEVWNMAQLPTVGHEQFYSILAASEDMVFMHVDDLGDSGVGTVYISDERGILFSKSLERHLYTTNAGDTDFTNVTSLRGVYMTSVLDEDGSVQTVVTFDQGARWQPLRKPWNSVCDSTAANPHMCSLHIHASYSISIKMNVPMPPHSEHNAVGLILAHGSVGDVGSLTSPDVYVSDDGGYTWLRALNGPHHYAILDSGGLLVAVEHVPHPVSQIKFSTDEGQCWHMFNFTDQPIFFTGLAAEPGARSMNVSLWGYRDFSRSQHWVSVTIDFRQVLSRDCGDGDYVQWLAHSDNTNGPTDGCVLGYKERFLRLRKDSVCWNGRDYVVMTDPTPCPCTLDDYQCDFGYFRPENSSECEPQPELKGQALEFCLHGNKEQLQTSGYRKIPGNHCQGGIMPERREIDLSTKCISNMIRPDTLTDSHVSLAPIVAVVISLLLVSAAAGVLLIKKYVCGGRFLVHRYSVLQQHAEANGIEGIDDFNIDGSSKMHYHDESDEDLLE